MVIKKHGFTLLLGGTLLAILTACTVAGFAYSFADRLILQEISSRYALNNEQEVRALRLIRERLYEHQQQEMPLYEDWLQNLRAAVKDQLTRDELNTLNARAEVLLERGIEKTLPLFAHLLADLSPEQIEYMREEAMERYAERAEEIAKENQDGDAGEELIDRLETWLGELSKEQRQLISNEVNSWPDNSLHWLKWRKQRFIGLVAFLQDYPSQSNINVYLHDHWLENKDMPESLQKSWQQSRQNFLDLLLKLDTTLSAEQRHHTVKKIDEWLAMLRSFQQEDIKPENT